MHYSEQQKEQIINRFIDWCEKIGYSDPDDPVRIEIVNGLPVGVKRAVQSLRFDVDLTNTRQNATME